MAETGIYTSRHVALSLERRARGQRHDRILGAVQNVRRHRERADARCARLHASLLTEELETEACGRAMLVQRIGAVRDLHLRVVRKPTGHQFVGYRKVRERTTEHARERALPTRHRRGDRGRGENEQVGLRARRVGENVAERDETAHRVAVEDHREVARESTGGRQLVFEIVVVLRPAVHVGAPSIRRAEPAQVVCPRVDARARERRCDVRVTPGVLSDAVDEQQVDAPRAGGPVQRAEPQAITRAGGRDLGTRRACHRATIEVVGPSFALIHSPLVGPFTWSAVARELASRGASVVVPDLGPPDEAAVDAHWRVHVERAARAVDALPADVRPILVGHSGAGPMLPAVRAAMRHEGAGYVFVDAGLPRQDEPRKGRGEFARHLNELHARGRRFPRWSDEDLRDVLPDDAMRAAVLREVRPQPPSFWDEIIPVFAGWPDAPCAYLRFGSNPSYDEAAAEARSRGWIYRELPGRHFHMLVDPLAVSDSLIAIASVPTDDDPPADAG